MPRYRMVITTKRTARETYEVDGPNLDHALESIALQLVEPVHVQKLRWTVVDEDVGIHEISSEKKAV